MGIYSTMNITREDCVDKIRAEIDNILLNGSDEQLEKLLFEVWGCNNFYNFSIVSEYQITDKYGYPLQYREKQEESEDYRRGYEDGKKS